MIGLFNAFLLLPPPPPVASGFVYSVAFLQTSTEPAVLVGHARVWAGCGGRAGCVAGLRVMEAYRVFYRPGFGLSVTGICIETLDTN